MSDNSRKFFDSREEMVAFTAQMKILGVKFASISFQGGGDSGEIESVDLYNMASEDMPMPNDMVSWTKQVYEDQERTQKDISVRNVIEDIGYRVLDATGMDWYNNEGGQGEVRILFDNEMPVVEVDMAINIINTEDHEFNYSTINDEELFYNNEEKQNAP